MHDRDLDRFNAVNCKRLGCRNKTRRYDGFCSDRCLAAVSPRTAVSDRGTATRSARGRDTGSSSALLPLPRASSSSRYATGLDAPACDPLATSQARERGSCGQVPGVDCTCARPCVLLGQRTVVLSPPPATPQMSASALGDGHRASGSNPDHQGRRVNPARADARVSPHSLPRTSQVER